MDPKLLRKELLRQYPKLDEFTADLLICATEEELLAIANDPTIKMFPINNDEKPPVEAIDDRGPN